MEEYSGTMKEMKELYKTILTLPSTRVARRQVLVAGAIGVGLGLLESLLFKDPKQQQIIEELEKT